MKTEDHGIGPREHSFFITFLLHEINIWTGLGYLLIEYFGKTINLFGGLSIAVGIFTVGYIAFFKKRTNVVISADMNILKGSILVILTLIYTVPTIYLMLETGNYIRQKLHADLPL
jgi:hypothetical protein